MTKCVRGLFRHVLGLFFTIVVGVANANAAVIVDNSPDTTGVPKLSCPANSFPLQYVGDRFTLSSNTTITGGAIFSNAARGLVNDPVRFVILPDVAGVPGTTPVLDVVTSLDAIDSSLTTSDTSMTRKHATLTTPLLLPAGDYWFYMSGNGVDINQCMGDYDDNKYFFDLNDSNPDLKLEGGFVGDVFFTIEGTNPAHRTWDFAITIDKDYGTASLPIGTVLAGSVSLDDTGLPMGTGISQTGLLTGLSFLFGGVHYDETTANTGYLEFNPDGSLFALSFGNQCYAGGCSAGSNSETWFLVIGSAREGGENDPEDFDFSGNTASGVSVFGDMIYAEQLNDPDSLLHQLGTAVTGVGPGHSLADKIALAQSYFATLDIQATCDVLTDFANQVRAQKGKKLTSESADQLIVNAKDIMAAIACS